MTLEIILTLLSFVVCFSWICYYRKYQQRKQSKYVVGFDSSNFAASTTEDEAQPTADGVSPQLVDLQPAEVFELDYDEDP